MTRAWWPNAGLILIATLAARLDLEALVNATVRLAGRVGGALPGRKVLTLVHAIAAGGSHIDHAEVLRSGGTARVLGHRVMAPSTLGTFLRSFSFGHVRQLEAVVGSTLEWAWKLGAGPGARRLVIDVDSTICEVTGKNKQGAAFGYTKVLGYHPILATRADTGEILHARMRKGSAEHRPGHQTLRRGARRPGPASRSERRVGHALRLRVLVERDHHRLGAGRRALHHGRADQQQSRGQGDRGDRRRRLDRHRLHPRRRGPGRRDALQRPSPGGPPHPAHRRPPSEVVAGLAPLWLSHRPGRRHTSPSTSFTVNTPWSSWPSATSKKAPGSNTSPRATSPPTAPGSNARC